MPVVVGRTQAEQVFINSQSIGAELYDRQILQNQQNQIQQLADFVGASMQRMEANQPHNKYAAATNPQPQPPFDPPPPSSGAASSIPSTPAQPVVNPIDGIIERLRQRREAYERKLHEEIAATQQSVSQIVSQKEGEVQRAREMARMAVAATGDEIRAKRSTQAFMQTLQSELRSATNANMMQQREIEAMKKSKSEFDRQHMENDIEKARREKARLDR